MADIGFPKRATAAIAMVVGYFALQALTIVMHEFAHSTMAWALGYTRTPLTVVWGNPVTMQGWDEGVPYDALFPERGHVAEAVIGSFPLLVHLCLVVALTAWLRRARAVARPVLFFAGYWFLVINLAELIAYVWMRPFIPGGDTGHFNHGLDISPWILLSFGSAFLLTALWLLHAWILPEVGALLPQQRPACVAIVLATGFVLFLWGSGLRFLVLYPDPMWRHGVIGLILFFAWIAVELLQPSRGESPNQAG